MDHKQATTAALVMLCENWGRNLTPQLVEMHMIALRGLDAQKIVEGATYALTVEQNFMPTTGQFLAMCRTPIHGGQSPDRDRDGNYIPLLDSVATDMVLNAINAVSSRYAGNESMTHELAMMEKNIRNRRKTDTPNEDA
ncbi:MAG: hypothetical protein O7D91_21540 [Planctomycetota bacterium]|nr:hypothetical protein [Planctomycetota bacterium]